MAGLSMTVQLYLGDCLSVMAELPENSVDTIITDPPYGLTFMGKDWDRGVPGVAFWEQALRVAKPGAMLLAMGGTRTFHRLVCAIEDAGWEVRDSMAWLYGSGFPKSYDISKGIDKYDATEARRNRDLRFTKWMRSTGLTASEINEITNSFMGSHYLTDKEQPAVPTADMFDKLRPHISNVPQWVERAVEQRTIESENFKKREVVGKQTAIANKNNDNTGRYNWNTEGQQRKDYIDITAPATPAAQLWHGWGTALKPAMELICVAMKPIDGTYVNNALTWGVAGFWIDGGRVEGKPRLTGTRQTGDEINAKPSSYLGSGTRKLQTTYDKRMANNQLGRFPANFIHDGSDEVMELFPETVSKWGNNTTYNKNPFTPYEGSKSQSEQIMPESYDYDRSGSAARFFYCAKASRSERNAGLEGMEERDASKMSGGEETRTDRLERGLTNHSKMQNHHPTVKPLALMRYLARLTKTPTGGVVLDPFMGSGTTGMAAVLEGRDFIGIELNAEYLEIAERRIAHAQGSIPVELPLFAEAAE